MKFSVLLPTRNRLELLRLAVESVQIQDHSDWEILISDNASDSDIAAEMAKLGDARIKVRRSNRLVAVTDNWNESLSMASGEYVIMLGDDDALVLGALSKLQILLEEWAYPDAIYAQARQYAYANVVPGHPAAFMQTGYNAFLEGSTEPFRMSRDIARKMVRGALAFRILYGFNMQHFVFSRRLVERLQPKGPFFQSPYPDYYAANAILLASDTLVVTPDCISLIGISPKSFGFYYVNSNEKEGDEFLNNRATDVVANDARYPRIPGSSMNDSWLCAMETLKQNFPDEGTSISHFRYRSLQYHAVLQSGGKRRYWTVLRAMRLWEIPVFGLAAVTIALARVLPGKMSRRVGDAISHALFSRSPRFDPKRRDVPYRSILEAARGSGA